MTREAMEREVDRWYRYARNWQYAWFAAIATSGSAVFSSFFIPNPYALVLNMVSLAFICVAWYAVMKMKEMHAEADKTRKALDAGGDW